MLIGLLLPFGDWITQLSFVGVAADYKRLVFHQTDIGLFTHSKSVAEIHRSLGGMPFHLELLLFFLLKLYLLPVLFFPLFVRLMLSQGVLRILVLELQLAMLFVKLMVFLLLLHHLLSLNFLNVQVLNLSFEDHFDCKFLLGFVVVFLAVDLLLMLFEFLAQDCGFLIDCL